MEENCILFPQKTFAPQQMAPFLLILLTHQNIQLRNILNIPPHSQNEETLENGVCDFYNDINIEQMDMEVEAEEIEEDEDIYDMFADLNLSENMHTEFQFKEDNSEDEDAVLDNSNVELENVTLVKQKKTEKGKYEKFAACYKEGIEPGCPNW